MTIIIVVFGLLIWKSANLIRHDISSFKVAAVFSKTAEYALRAVFTIAEAEDEFPVLAKDIAQKGKVPDKYLSKVLRDLVRAGVLTSSRGIGGGFRLRKKPSAIKIGDIIKTFDNDFSTKHCLLGRRQCSDENPCPLHFKWKPVLKKIQDFLDQTTVKDLIDKS